MARTTHGTACSHACLRWLPVRGRSRFGDREPQGGFALTTQSATARPSPDHRHSSDSTSTDKRDQKMRARASPVANLQTNGARASATSGRTRRTSSKSTRRDCPLHAPCDYSPPRPGCSAAAAAPSPSRRPPRAFPRRMRAFCLPPRALPEGQREAQPYAALPVWVAEDRAATPCLPLVAASGSPWG